MRTIQIPTLSQSIRNLTEWVRLAIRVAIVFIMAFTLAAFVMQFVPLVPKYWTVPHDANMMLIALAAAFYALK